IAAFVAVTLVAWLAAAPAWASSAGLCSKNGTSEVAPPPLLIPIESSLEQGDPASCEAAWADKSVQRDNEQRIEPQSSGPEAILQTLPTISPARVTHV